MSDPVTPGSEGQRAQPFLSSIEEDVLCRVSARMCVGRPGKVSNPNLADRGG